MKTFLAVYKCAENSPHHDAWKKLTSIEQNQRLEMGRENLTRWTEKYRDQIVYYGGPLDEKTKIVDRQGIREAPSSMGEFLVLKANSQLEAAQIFLDHPHFTYFPGDGIEVVECKSRHE